ncbi:IclR family transcriptional regulator [Microbacterium sp. zg.B96]|uniref:IclR family transcriptional regulator n=1 Tax=Microbacterium sp. zg.B96 TaxID=2969409 RepID=UPI0027E2462F|nr:IclR family transcriptional regulator [Microbacterium sp. zg.B96]
MRTADWTDSVSVLDRLTAVFEAFTEDDEGLGISELARRANLPKSTVSRISAELVAQRLLDREGDKLYLGVRLFELGQTVVEPRRLRRAALPVMTDLRNMTGYTVNLAVLDVTDVVCIATVLGVPATPPVLRVGGRLPAHATALGKAILAFSPPEAVHALASDGVLGRRTPQTVGDLDALVQELGEARRLGTAVEREQCVVGRACVASPIMGRAGVPLAAISVAGSVDDVEPERVAAAVHAAAMTLTRRVGAHRNP